MSKQSTLRGKYSVSNKSVISGNRSMRCVVVNSYCTTSSSLIRFLLGWCRKHKRNSRSRRQSLMHSFNLWNLCNLVATRISSTLISNVLSKSDASRIIFITSIQFALHVIIGPSWFFSIKPRTLIRIGLQCIAMEEARYQGFETAIIYDNYKSANKSATSKYVNQKATST